MSKLPSINDFLKNSNLPSINDFLGKDENLPSVNSYIVEEKIEEPEEELTEEIVVVQDEPQQDLTEIIRLINDVRESIPDIPEIKYYDNELSDLSEELTQLIESVRQQIPTVPDVIYYDNEIQDLETRLDEVQNSIPKFPKWINEVNEVPDFSWIGKTFSVIDDDFVKVNDNIDLVKDALDREVESILENINIKSFETKVDIKGVRDNLNETKQRIYEELKEAATRIWDLKRQFRGDQKSLREELRKEYFVLDQNVSEKIDDFTSRIEDNELSTINCFEELKKEIRNLPEVKYYDKEIFDVKSNIKELYSLVNTIKTEQQSIQENLQEGLLNEPPSTPESVDGQKDPLTPMDQKFATLEDLSKHYSLFINRIQQQISTIGGGGAGFVKDLDDVTITSIANHDVLVYNSATEKWENEVGVQRLILDVRNNTGATLSPGTPVYETAYNSGQDRINIATSDASDSTTMPAKGVVCDAIDNNSNGFIVVSGELEGVDTSAFNVADELYVAPGGGLTNTRPSGDTELVQKIATVLKKSAGNGVILVHGAGRTNDVPNTISIGGSVTAADFFKVDGTPIGEIAGIDTTGTSNFNTIVAVGASFTGNISVAGTITYDDVTNVDSIGIVTARSGITLGDNSSTTVVALNAVSTTTTSTDEATADSFDASVYRSAKYQISMTRGSEFHMTEILVIHNGTTTFDTEYGTIKTGVSLATFDSDIDSGNVRLLVTPTSATSTTIQMFRTLIEI